MHRTVSGGNCPHWQCPHASVRSLLAMVPMILTLEHKRHKQNQLLVDSTWWLATADGSACKPPAAEDGRASAEAVKSTPAKKKPRTCQEPVLLGQKVPKHEIHWLVCMQVRGVCACACAQHRPCAGPCVDWQLASQAESNMPPTQRAQSKTITMLASPNLHPLTMIACATELIHFVRPNDRHQQLRQPHHVSPESN